MLTEGPRGSSCNFDFVAATGVSVVGSNRSPNTAMKLAKGAFSSLTAFVEARSGVPPFPAARANVTSLAPFGFRVGLAGLNVAPRFLAMQVWLPFLHRLSRDQADPCLTPGALPIRSLPVASPLLYSLLGKVLLGSFLPRGLLPAAPPCLLGFGFGPCFACCCLPACFPWAYLTVRNYVAFCCRYSLTLTSMLSNY